MSVIILPKDICYNSMKKQAEKHRSNKLIPFSSCAHCAWKVSAAMAAGGMHPPLTPGGGPRGPRGRGIRGARTPGARTPGGRMRGPRPGAAGMGPTGPRMPGPQGMPGPHSDPSMQGKTPLQRSNVSLPFDPLIMSQTHFVLEAFAEERFAFFLLGKHY